MLLMGGVLAAGYGRRLNSPIPKALVEVDGKPLIAHAIEQLRAAGVDRVLIIANSQAAADVHASVAHEPRIYVVVKDTPSALATFEVLLDLTRPHAFIFIAVDSILPPGTGRQMASSIRRGCSPLVLGIAPSRDNAEDQLRAEVDDDGNILRLGSTGDGPGLVTAGIYAGRSSELPLVPKEHPRWGLRHYLGWIVSDVIRTSAVRLPWGFDIDTQADLQVAASAMHR
jgi:choline kinase